LPDEKSSASSARVRTLRNLFVMRHSNVVARMQSAIARDTEHVGHGRALAEAYGQLPTVDFSRHVLPGAEGVLRVMKVGDCGWSDIGTPARLLETLCGLPREISTNPVKSDIVPLNLLMRHASKEARGGR
jgi:hypothetical protein